MKDFLTPSSKDVIELLEPTIIKRLTKEKRGQGSGKDYKPFLTVSGQSPGPNQISGILEIWNLEI